MIFLIVGIIIGSVTLCNGIIIGGCSTSDTVLLTRYAATSAMVGSPLDLTIKLNSISEITCIRIDDLRKDTDVSYFDFAESHFVAVLSGGIGQKNIEFTVQSEAAIGVQYLIKVYGVTLKPEDIPPN